MKIFFSGRVPAIVLVSVLAQLWWGCGSDGDENIPLVVRVQAETIAYDKLGTFLYIETPGAWNAAVEENPAWCTLASGSGEGNATIVINTTRNDGDMARTAKIAVAAGGQSKSILITQETADSGNGSGGDGGDGSGSTPGQIIPSDPNSNWMELPANKTGNNGVFIAHFLPDGSGVRNYSMFYDTIQKIARWVAYPLCSKYIGSSGRTDAWGYDPRIPARLQPNMKRGLGSGNDRGHQIPSADRTCDRATNKTTFYYTNMTAQNSRLNQNLWGNLENKIRTWMGQCDTLYVVTGAMATTTGDTQVNYVYDNDGKPFARPKYYYKALLKRKGDVYWAVAFKLDNEVPASNDMNSYRISVKNLEEVTGFTFFPNIPNPAIKNSIDASQWK